MHKRVGFAVLLGACGLLGAAGPRSGPGEAGVFRANANGFDVTLFSPSSAYTFPNGHWLAGDIDKDGSADIIHIREDSRGADADVMISNGDGTFKVVHFNPGQGYPTRQGDWLVGDVNGDGRADIVHQPQDKKFVMAWLSNGDGTFNIHRTDKGGGMPNGPWLIGDITGDGRADLVQVVENSNHVDEWISRGDGTFDIRSFSPAQDYAVANGYWMMGRFNNDAMADIVHFVRNSNYAHVWLAKGDGTFNVGTFRPWNDYPMPTAPVTILPIGNIPIVGDTDFRGVHLTADLNGDGLTDIVHVVDKSDTANIWIATGNSGPNSDPFNMASFRPFPGRTHAQGAWLTGDINGDGRADVIHAVDGTDEIDIWFSNGDGSFSVGIARAWPGYPIGGPSSPAQVWLAADISGDQHADLFHAYRLEPVRAMQVVHHATVALSDGEAEGILNEMTEVLFRNDGASDQTCTIRFALGGPVGAFSQRDGIINNEDDFNAIAALPGNVKVVNQINWCHEPGDYLGCAMAGQNSLTVVRQKLLEGTLWAHEFSHTRGLGHRFDDPAALMNEFVNATTRSVAPAECQVIPR